MKTFGVVRIELGVVEAETLEEAIEIANDQGFNVGHSTEKMYEDTDPDYDFWASLEIENVEQLLKITNDKRIS